MIVNVDIPLLGTVLVMTAPTDFYVVSCPNKPSGTDRLFLRPLVIYRVSCGLLSNTLILYADVADGVDLTDLVTKLLGATIINYPTTLRTTQIRPVG